MKPYIILYIATSRDGFIADKDGGIDWLNEFSATLPKDMDCGYGDFFNSVDLIVMGKNTYEQMLTFGDWPNAGKDSYIFTDSTEQPPRNDIFFVNTDVKDFMDRISKEKPECKVWLEGGAQLAQSFYDAGLIDEYIITEIPIDLGQGIALARPIVEGKGMQEAEVIDFGHEIVQKVFKK